MRKCDYCRNLTDALSCHNCGAPAEYPKRSVFSFPPGQRLEVPEEYRDKIVEFAARLALGKAGQATKKNLRATLDFDGECASGFKLG